MQARGEGTQTPVSHPVGSATQTAPMHCLHPHTIPSKATKSSPSADRVGGATSGLAPPPTKGTLLGVQRWLCCLAQPSNPGPAPQPAPRLGGVTPTKAQGF